MSSMRQQDAHMEEHGRIAAPPPSPQRPNGAKKLAGRYIPAALCLVTVLAVFAAFGFSIERSQAASTQPEANAITITAQTQTFTYSSQITFQLHASDTSGTITKAGLEIKVPQLGLDRQLNVPVEQPGSSIALTYRYDSSNDDLPPFGPITYHWTLSDNAQHSLTGSNQHFDFADTRFTWQHLTQGDISIYWYNQSTSYGQNILDTAEKEATSIEQDLNGTLTAPLRVLIYASNDDLQAGLPANSPQWAGGVALISFDEALIVVGGSQYALQRDLPHELTHLIFHEIAGQDCGGCPLWFDEGMAVYHQLYHEPEMQLAFDDAVKSQQLLPFNSIVDRFPQDSSQAEVAYAQSWNYITYLYSTYGQPKVAHLVDALHNTAFSAAFQQAFGRSPAQMENQWRVSLGLPAIQNNPVSTPSTGTSSGQPSSAAASSGNGALSAIGFALILLVLAGGVAMYLVQRRNRAAIPATSAAPWPMPSAGVAAPFAAPHPPGYAPGTQPSYPPVLPPRGIPTDQRYQQQIERRQALLRTINELLAAEKSLNIQRADLERQIGFYAAQEGQARSAGNEAQAMQALAQRHWLGTTLASLQQQLAQVRSQQQQAIGQERQISAGIDAAFSQQASLPSAAPGGAWPPPASNIPAPRRRVSQE